MNFTILVIGSGGREHALVEKFSASPHVDKIYCAPGNPSMLQAKVELINIAETDNQALLQFAKKQQVSWTFVGPELPLLNGIVDCFQKEGLLIFGPKKQAAMIEGSKDFAKKLMHKYQIPTAAYQTVTSVKAAEAYLDTCAFPIVIKADGLAAGKGVVIAQNRAEALQACTEMLEHHRFGASGAKVVIEEFLTGEEFSLLAFVNGSKVYPMIPAQDHKRTFDDDRGPNTGGMGAYAPVPFIAPEQLAAAVEAVLKPAAAGLVAENRSFTGILYAGLMATDKGIKVIEFNARFGDPETQVILPRLTSDLALIIDDLLHDKEPIIEWQATGFTLGVVVAAKGYPGSYLTGRPLPRFTLTTEEFVYYAGVKQEHQQLVSAGGRVFLLGASADTLAQAQHKVYHQLAQVSMNDLFYRKDIGKRGIEEDS